MERPKIGELLVAAGVIEPDVLETALEKQRAQGGGRLGGILVRMGVLDEDLLVRTVARQLELPVAWLRGKQVKPEVLSQLPREIALRHRCLPVMIDRKEPETLLVAMEDPSDTSALDEVALAAGRPVRVVLAAPSELDDALARHYPGEPPQEAESEEEPELLLTDPLGESASAGPELRRVASDDAEQSPLPPPDPLDLGGDYEPATVNHDAPDEAGADEPAGERAFAGVDLETDPLMPGVDAAPADLDQDPAPAPHRVRPGHRARPGDSLDDAIDEVRGASDLALDSDDEELAQDEELAHEAPSLFGDDPLEATLPPPPPRPARADALPRDPELRAVVLLLIERGLVTREEVAARLRSPDRDGDVNG
ncbi:MAG TPA: hypothetical protein VMW19_03475 [Myxococcota bacterium]|nr:hypothetical protein [Myxococcota bacterium]